MRKEYDTINTVGDIFNAIDDFFAKPSIAYMYELVDTQDDRRVYHNLSEDLYLIFYDTIKHRVYDIDNGLMTLLVVSEYDNTLPMVWFNKDLVCNGIKTHSMPTGSGYIHRMVLYFPAPTLILFKQATKSKLVINYNRDGSTFLFSLRCTMPFEDEVNEAFWTSSICVGAVEQMLDFDGGFFYGGDFMLTYEMIYGEDHNGNEVADYGYVVYDSGFNNLSLHTGGGSSWSNDPYGTTRAKTLVNPDSINRLDVILRADIDYAPERKKNDKLEPPTGFFRADVPTIVRNQIWAVTMDLDYYVPMVCSITNSDKAVPSYAPLLSKDHLDKGQFINTLNKMSSIVPLWFMVRRDPEVLDDYSCVGKNDNINYVNMRYMSSDTMVDTSFPTRETVDTYNCFDIGSRRSWFGMKGYSGLAFKTESLEYDPSDPSTYPDWMSYPQDLSVCGVVQGQEHKDGYHFFPDVQQVLDADFMMFVLKLAGIGVIYVKPNYDKVLDAVQNNKDFDVFSDAMVYKSKYKSLPVPPDMPKQSEWGSPSSVPGLAGVELHLRDYADISHFMFSGNAQFDAIFEEGEAYLCNETEGGDD